MPVLEMMENEMMILMKQKKSPLPTDRAWAVIDRKALRTNAALLQSLMPPNGKLMAVVKANAYGHGDLVISEELNRIGVYDFAVATLTEGIHLRENGIAGNILILGVTNPMEAQFLAEYGLTQTVVSAEYAKKLNGEGEQIKVHLKIDTGMHRLGIGYRQIEEMMKVFSCENLILEGVFTHLCTADSLKKEDVAFTNRQIERFFHAVLHLQKLGYDTGKLHMQSSYGLLNFPECACDYVRAGIALYGVYSDCGKTRISLPLKPVLSVKSRIVSIREIMPQESIGYGRAYTAEKPCRTAVISIGYADGIPRNLTDTGAYVLVCGKKAPVIGRVCMDQMTIDVTEIPDVKTDAEVTVIGSQGMETVSWEETAERCGTITNELLSRLGERLEHVILP